MPFEIEYKEKILEISTLYQQKFAAYYRVSSAILLNENWQKRKFRKTKPVCQPWFPTLSDVIAILDTDGTIKYKSPNIEKYFGWKPEELIGKSGFDTVHPDDLKTFELIFKTPPGSQETPMPWNIAIYVKTAAYRLVKLTATNLIHDPDD